MSETYLKMRTIICKECCVIETREIYEELRKTNERRLKVFREAQDADSDKIQIENHGAISRRNTIDSKKRF